MAVYSDINSFYAEVRKQVENSIKSVLPKLKEKAEDIVIEKIYGVYEPKVYYRIGQLLQAFDIRIDWQGDECIGTLFVKDITHSPNPTWIGEDHSLKEIITEYFTQSHTYTNGYSREGVDVMGTVNDEMIQTGQALQLLLSELKKYFDII